VPAGHPFRLPAPEYRGPRRYFLTICTEHRRPLFLDMRIGGASRDVLLNTATRYGFAVVAYCFMPDHLHTLLEGQTAGADFRKFVVMYKQRSAFAFRRPERPAATRVGGPAATVTGVAATLSGSRLALSGSRYSRLWQRSYFEHVLRREEDVAGVVAYILGNPVRAGLCASPEEYPLLGSDRYSIRELADVARGT